ncbi:uncharacterized protein LOC116181498 [Photinus pyralis]|uniref:uncharacterized protein LOC116181498 n=1 Tax=Photinus pyralis TaxID=7054 RepID=UPI001266FE31|nr:uncharacterized protein LOC116181498 [Photinus pyralis]
MFWIVLLFNLLGATNAVRLEACDEECLTQKRVAFVSPTISECVCATGVDWTLVYRYLYDRDFFTDACFMCFVRCVQLKTYTAFPDGTLNVDSVLMTFPDADRDALWECSLSVEHILDKCKRAYQMSICALDVIFGHH